MMRIFRRLGEHGSNSRTINVQNSQKNARNILAVVSNCMRKKNKKTKQPNLPFDVGNLDIETVNVDLLFASLLVC